MQTVHVGVGTATLQRLIGNFEYQLSGVSVSTSEQEIFVGIGVVTRSARLAGIVPTPASNFNQDWLYWTRRILKLQNVAGGPQFFSWDFEIRSRRRLRGGYDLILVVENIAQEVTTILTSSMRLLWSQDP